MKSSFLYIFFAGGLLIGVTLALMSCAQDFGGTGNTNGQYQGGPPGFTPGAPSNSTGFSPRGNLQYSNTGHSPPGSQDDEDTEDDDDCEEDPNLDKCKSQSVKDNEKRWGVSAKLKDVDYDVFTDFRLGEEINNVNDIVDHRVYVKIRKTGSGANVGRFYGGDVVLAYYDHYKKQAGTVKFESGTGDNAQYNKWLKIGNKTVFHGFFQEKESALVLVLDEQPPLPPVLRDPDGPDPPPRQNNLYNGSVWILTFKVSFPLSKSHTCTAEDQGEWYYIRDYNSRRGESLSQRGPKCWFVDRGHFDCRTWRDGNGVNTYRAIEPDGECYTKLAEFEKLDITKAFGVSNLSELFVWPVK